MQVNVGPRWIGAMRWAWWALAGLAVLYGSFALMSGAGLLDGARDRAWPAAFAVHAVAGGLALLAGAGQGALALSGRSGPLHRWLGRLYAVAVGATALAGTASLAAADFGGSARLSFAALCLLWVATTLAGWRAIRGGLRAAHRDWMIRSYALALFFVSFTFWVPLLAGDERAAEPWFGIAVTLSWAVNLALAEALVRGLRRRSRRGAPA